MSLDIKVAFIGCGNMGGALALSAAKSGCKLMLADPDGAKSGLLAQMTGGIATSNDDCAAKADYIFMAVKPQIIGTVLEGMAPTLAARTDRFVIVSMAVGVEIDTIHAHLGFTCPTIRIMPNTPASIGAGVILYCSKDITEAEESAFCTLMQNAGVLDSIPEKLIDSGSALSGCGPAFVYQFIEALADGAVDAGLPRDKALMYAEHTVAGAALLALQSGEHPGKLKDAVCSPGGSTIEGVRALEAGAFRSSVMEAVIASYNRTKELGK